MPFFCFGCNNLRVKKMKTKQRHFYVCLASLFFKEKIDKETESM